MKITLVVNKFDMTGKSPYLTNELAYAFRKLGDQVSVLYLDWDSLVLADSINDDDIVVHSMPAIMLKNRGKMQLIYKWLFSPFKYLILSRRVKKTDIVIYFSPAITNYSLILNPFFKTNYSLCIYWDFFPYHQVQLDLIPKGRLSLILQKIENLLLGNMNSIALMSESNRKQFNSIYPVSLHSRVVIIPIWGDTKNLGTAVNIRKDNKKICVFGGQLARGRNIESIINASPYLDSNIVLKIIGDGELFESLEMNINKNQYNNVELLGRLPREQYLEEIKNYDLGIIVTSVTTETNSFPSKVIDYFKAGLPIIAITEPGSDFGDFIEVKTQSGEACYSEDPKEIAHAINCLLKREDRAKLGKNGKSYFLENMVVDEVARKIKLLINVDK